MKHISIEGFDGVGKTTISNIVAKELGFKFIENHFMNCLMKVILLMSI